MRSATKIIFIVFILLNSSLIGQVNLNPGGLFVFVDTIPLDSNLILSPGTLTRDGKAYILGLSTGGNEDQPGLHSDLYRIGIIPEINKMKTEAMQLSNLDSRYQFYQCSLSEGNKTMVMVVNKGGGWDKNDLAIADDPSGKLNFTSFRVLDEINDSSASDAYPWLSDDGLRLYFTRNYRLMYTDRKTSSEKFATPVAVDFSGDVQLDIISVWLSDDELNLYMLADSRIFKSTRKKVSDPFGFPVLLTKEFEDLYFLAGMSFTPDGKTMYVFYYDGTNDYILIYNLAKGRI